MKTVKNLSNISLKIGLVLLSLSSLVFLSSLHSPDAPKDELVIDMNEMINFDYLSFQHEHQSIHFDSFEQYVRKFMDRWEIKGASIAIAKEGKMVYQNGIGWANAESQITASSHHKFRIASISKLITASAILKLYEDDKLKLDQKVFGKDGILNEYQLAGDPAYKNITIRHLLTHRAGWSSWEPDPMFMPTYIAKRMGVPAPAQEEDIIQFVLKHRRLRYIVGSKYAYSNVGYVILGEVIKKLSGQSYETFVQENLFNPLGIHGIKLGKSLPNEKLAWESEYYDYPQARMVESFDGSGQMVSKPNGGNYIEALAAAGGWIATAPDLLKFLLAIDQDAEIADILSHETLDLMLNPKNASMAFGWSGAKNGFAWRSGTLAGTSAYAFKDRNGFTWVVLMNSSVWNGHRFTRKIRYMMSTAMKRVNKWPEINYFDYQPTNQTYLPLAAY